jgi:hypothetical protein
MQPLLRCPGAGNHVRGGAALARPQRGADERMMAIVPGRFDEHAAQVGVAGFRDAPLRAFRTARVLGGHQAGERHGARGRGKATRVAEFRGDRERGEIIDAAEAAQPLDARPQGLELEEGPQIRFDVPEAGARFIDRAQIA